MDIYEVGVLSANKVLLILLPFITFLTLNGIWALAVFCICLLMVMVLGYFHLIGILSVDIESTTGLKEWIVQFTLIGLVSLLIYLITQNFKESYERYIKNLVLKNEEISRKEESLTLYKTQLEVRVDERTRDLRDTNLKLADKALELHKTLENLNNAQERLLETEKMASLGLLATGVAHEINNPLNQIIRGVSLLEMRMRDDENYAKDTEMLRLLSEVKLGVKRASKIVFSLNQYGPNHASMNERCDIHDILKYCIFHCKRDMPDSVTIETEFDATLYVMNGNIAKIHQVFINLISNSGQAIKGKGSINVKTASTSDLLSINISDTGEGIAKEHLSKIYEPFFTTKAPSEGTGLGLYIVFGIVREHDGKLFVTSEVGKGTDIKLTFPL
ncbi:MAG: C4-dicarboxylate-specific signal transduction histidine kinase [Marinoscillum sp.]